MKISTKKGSSKETSMDSLLLILNSTLSKKILTTKSIQSENINKINKNKYACPFMAGKSLIPSNNNNKILINKIKNL